MELLKISSRSCETKVHCDNCGKKAIRTVNHSDNRVTTQCEYCDYFMIRSLSNASVIEACTNFVSWTTAIPMNVKHPKGVTQHC
jgi:hypothetical protein